MVWPFWPATQLSGDNFDERPCLRSKLAAPVGSAAPPSTGVTHQSYGGFSVGTNGGLSGEPTNNRCLPSGDQTGRSAYANSGCSCRSDPSVEATTDTSTVYESATLDTRFKGDLLAIRGKPRVSTLGGDQSFIATDCRNNVDPASLSLGAKYDFGTVRRKSGLMVICLMICQAHRLSTGNVFHPDVEIPRPTTVGSIGHQLTVRRECRLISQAGVRCYSSQNRQSNCRRRSGQP